MGCVVSVYLDKRGPMVTLGVAPIPLLKSRQGATPKAYNSGAAQQTEDPHGLTLYKHIIFLLSLFSMQTTLLHANYRQ